MMAYGEPAVMLTYTDRQVVCTDQTTARYTAPNSSQLLLLGLGFHGTLQQHTVGLTTGATLDTAQSVDKKPSAVMQKA